MNQGQRKERNTQKCGGFTKEGKTYLELPGTMEIEFSESNDQASPSASDYAFQATPRQDAPAKQTSNQ